MDNQLTNQTIGKFDVFNVTITGGVDVSLMVRARGMVFERLSNKGDAQPLAWKIIYEDEEYPMEQQYQDELEAMFKANLSPDITKLLL